MHLYLIDGIGPFFRAFQERKINWSKLPFSHLATDELEGNAQFRQIREDVDKFADRAESIGYNAITFDDVVHLTDHPWYEQSTRNKIQYFTGQFSLIFDVAIQKDMHVFVTMDVFSSTSGLEIQLEENNTSVDEFIADILRRFFSTYKKVAGVIVRIGESDGLDVEDDIKSHLYIKTAQQLNQLLHNLLPVCEEFDRYLILRT